MTDRETANYRYWCSAPEFDEKTKSELAGIESDHEEIRDRFCRELEFGTGGLRGIIGAGTNRMNIYTVGKATQGLADYIKTQKNWENGVVIAFDSRHMSSEFARSAALCFNANGIQTYLFYRLEPVPMLSYAVRRLGCKAGIMITASHNPPEYNGYKVFWEDGGQITFPRDREIMEKIKAVESYETIRWLTEEESVKAGLFHTLGEETEMAFLKDLEAYIVSPEAIKKYGADIKIVYSPLHGTGKIPVCTLLQRLGFSRTCLVSEQAEPDGNFPTVVSPNPEEPEAFSLALKRARLLEADLVLATDPDADRLGVYVRDKRNGEYHAFNGNMTGILLCEYLLSRRQESGQLPGNGAVVKTIVTTRMAEPLAAHFGVKLIDVLTGFKYIGEQMRIFEQDGSYSYQFGFEESYGCLVESCVRDKDAVSAVMTLCEAAAYYHGKGSSLWEEMLRLYETYGYYKEDLVSVTLKGCDGPQKINNIMEKMRANPPLCLGPHRVLKIEDYQTGILSDTESGKTLPTGLPKSNVLRFLLEEEAWFCLRPSGTEPKIKFYFGVKGDSIEDARKKLAQLKDSVMRWVGM